MSISGGYRGGDSVIYSDGESVNESDFPPLDLSPKKAEAPAPSYKTIGLVAMTVVVCIILGLLAHHEVPIGGIPEEAFFGTAGGIATLSLLGGYLKYRHSNESDESDSDFDSAEEFSPPPSRKNSVGNEKWDLRTEYTTNAQQHLTPLIGENDN